MSHYAFRLRLPQTFVLLTLLSGTMYAQRCHEGTITGKYSFSITGLRPAASAPGQLEQVIAVGVRDFDGMGGYTQVMTEKGSLTAAAVVDAPGSGTYTVNRDCTGTFTSAAGFQSRFVIQDNGKEIRWIVVTPSVVTVAAHAVRQ